MRQTSKEAFVASRDGARKHKNIILSTLKRVGRPLIAEEIAKYADLEHSQVGRRMSELEREDKVTRTDITGLTTKGRRAFKWKLN